MFYIFCCGNSGREVREVIPYESVEGAFYQCFVENTKYSAADLAVVKKVVSNPLFLRSPVKIILQQIQMEEREKRNNLEGIVHDFSFVFEAVLSELLRREIISIQGVEEELRFLGSRLSLKAELSPQELYLVLEKEAKSIPSLFLS